MPEALTQPAKLLVKLHGKGSRHIDLTHETFTIGRKADNTLAIEDPAVSGHHARIVKIQAVFFLEDLKSTNGTALNGQPITRHQLHDADMITIGQHRLVFQESAPASAAHARRSGFLSAHSEANRANGTSGIANESARAMRS